MEKQKFNVNRTPEGTAFELAFVVLAVAVWVGIILMLRHAPDIVPTHFGPSGQPDAYGNKLTVLLPCIMTTVVGACCLAGAYFPHTVNLPVRIRNERQAALGVRLMRIIAIAMLLLTLAVAYSAIGSTAAPALLVVVGLIVVCGVFTYLIYKAK